MSRAAFSPFAARIFAALLGALAALPAAGQHPHEGGDFGPPPDNVHFDRLTVEDGLPNRHVTAIHQDRYGYVWLGTRDGLARFDGRRVTTYLHDPMDPSTLGGSYVSALYEGRGGDLWVVLGVGGLDRFDRARETFVHHAAGPDGLTSNSVTAIHEDRSGHAWVGTGDAGVARLDPDGAARQHPGVGSVKAITEDGAGRLWVGTCGNGLQLYDAAAESFRAQPLGDGDTGRCVTGLATDPGGRLWAMTRRGLYGLREGGPRQDGSSFEHRLAGQNVTSLDFEADGRLWAVASGRIWSREPTGQFRLHLHFPTADMVRPYRANILLVDRREVVWVGTEDGLLRFHRAADRFETYRHSPFDPHSLGNDHVDQLFEDRTGTLWIGTRGRGVSRFARSRWKFYTYRHDPTRASSLSSDEVAAVAEDEAARGLWVATRGGGLNFFNPRAETFEAWRHDPADAASLASDFLNDLAVDQHGNLWIAHAGRGLDRRLPDGSFVHYRHHPDDPTTLSSNAIADLAVDEDGGLWAAAFQAPLNRVDPATGAVRRYPVEVGGVRPNVWTVRPAGCACGHLWIGTAGTGLLRLDRRTGEVRQFTWDPSDPTSISNRTVYDVLPDGGADWVGTFSGGLNRYHAGRTDPAAGTFSHLTVRDGLPSNRVTAILRDGDHLWLGTAQGIAQVDVGAEPPTLVRSFDRADGLVHNEVARGAALRAANGDLYFGGTGGLARYRAGVVTTNEHPPPVVLTGFSRGGRQVRLDRPLEEVDEVVVEHGDRVFSLEFAALDFAQPSSNRYRHRLEGFDDGWVGNGGTVTYTNIDPGSYVFRVQAANNDGVWNDAGLRLGVRVLPPFWGTTWFRLLVGGALAGLLALAFVAQRWRLEAAQREEIRRRDHARKTEELETARRVQLAMLPRRDLELDLGGGLRVQVAGRMVTAAEVGGDYYDYLLPSGTVSERTASGGLVVACGDAIGHGTAAGLLVGMAKAALRHELLRGRPRLRDVLSALNATLESAVTSRKSGMGLILLRLGPGGPGLTVEMAVAAMPPVMVYSPRDDTLRSFELHGLPLGLVETVDVAEQHTDLHPGDVLVMVSDGLAERQDASGELWGYDGVEKALGAICREDGGGRAVEIAEHLLTACDDFAGGYEPQDDMTVVVVRLES